MIWVGFLVASFWVQITDFGVRSQMGEASHNKGRRGGSVVSASHRRVESSSPGRCTHVVFLGKILNSHNASLHPDV